MTEYPNTEESVKTAAKAGMPGPRHRHPDAELDDPPLSNRVISVRHSEKTAAKIAKSSTSGTAKVFPSMLVVERERSEAEEHWYYLLARWGQSKNKRGPVTRGKIDHFSRSARFRMLKRLGTIGRQDPPFMLTLNYRSGEANGAKAKRDLFVYRKWLDRQFGEASFVEEEYVTKGGLHKSRKRWSYKGNWGGVWRYEVTTGRGKRAKAKTPHFHILIWCDDWQDMSEGEHIQLQRKLSERWCEITGDIDDDRIKYGCRLDRSDGNQVRIKNYMLGHQAKKTDQEACGGGKHWGMLNAHNLQLDESSEEVTLTPTQRARLARIVAKLIAKRTGQRPRDLTSVDYVHAVASPWDIGRILENIKQD